MNNIYIVIGGSYDEGDQIPGPCAWRRKTDATKVALECAEEIFSALEPGKYKIVRTMEKDGYRFSINQVEDDWACNWWYVSKMILK